MLQGHMVIGQGRHTAYSCVSPSTSTVTPNFVQIGTTFCARTSENSKLTVVRLRLHRYTGNRHHLDIHRP